jgi:hypothetical protein
MDVSSYNHRLSFSILWCQRLLGDEKKNRTHSIHAENGPFHGVTKLKKICSASVIIIFHLRKAVPYHKNVPFDYLYGGHFLSSTPTNTHTHTHNTHEKERKNFLCILSSCPPPRRSEPDTKNIAGIMGKDVFVVFHFLSNIITCLQVTRALKKLTYLKNQGIIVWTSLVVFFRQPDLKKK